MLSEVAGKQWCFSWACSACLQHCLTQSYHSSSWIKLFLLLHLDYTPSTAVGILNRQCRTWAKVGVLACRLACERAGQQRGKVRSRWGSCLLLLHLAPLAGNKQSFSTDRYMQNHCYLCSQINQIMDYSSLELTLSLSSIFAKVSQFHTLLYTWVYVKEILLSTAKRVSAHKRENTGCTDNSYVCVVTSEHYGKQWKISA